MSKSLRRCAECRQEVPATSLAAHLRHELAYDPWSCALCRLRFADLEDAWRHFDREFGRHPGEEARLVERIIPDKERRLRVLMDSSVWLTGDEGKEPSEKPLPPLFSPPEVPIPQTRNMETEVTKSSKKQEPSMKASHESRSGKPSIKAWPCNMDKKTRSQATKPSERSLPPLSAASVSSTPKSEMRIKLHSRNANSAGFPPSLALEEQSQSTSELDGVESDVEDEYEDAVEDIDETGVEDDDEAAIEGVDHELESEVEALGSCESELEDEDTGDKMASIGNVLSSLPKATANERMESDDQNSSTVTYSEEQDSISSDTASESLMELDDASISINLTLPPLSESIAQTAIDETQNVFVDPETNSQSIGFPSSNAPEENEATKAEIEQVSFEVVEEDTSPDTLAFPSSQRLIRISEGRPSPAKPPISRSTTPGSSLTEPILSASKEPAPKAKRGRPKKTVAKIDGMETKRPRRISRVAKKDFNTPVVTMDLKMQANMAEKTPMARGYCRVCMIDISMAQWRIHLVKKHIRKAVHECVLCDYYDLDWCSSFEIRSHLKLTHKTEDERFIKDNRNQLLPEIDALRSQIIPQMNS